MKERERTALSKFLTLVLRHRPELVGVELDRSGWVAIDELVARCRRYGTAISPDALLEVVETSPKRRFAISMDGLRIRASQGHSVKVDLGYKPVEPPDFLFHGTVAKNLATIRVNGLKRLRRHHVHLSPDRETAARVGGRHGRPVIVVIRAKEMVLAGHEFYISANGVWLTEQVPARYIEFPS